MSTTQDDPIRVLIVDSDPRIGQALLRLLQDAAGLEVVAVATDGAAALARAGQFQPTVALIEAQAARLDGLALIRRLRQQVPAMRVVVVSVYAALGDPALAAGACRFLLKDSSRAELVAAIVLAAHEDCQTSGDDPDDDGRLNRWRGGLVWG